MKALNKLLVFTTLALYASAFSSAYANDSLSVVVYHSPKSNFQSSLAQAINRHLYEISPDTQVRFNTSNDLSKIHKGDLLISIGNHEIIDKDLSTLGNDVIYIHDSKQEHISRHHYNAHTNIEITQPSCRYLNLIYALNKKWNRVGYLTTDPMDGRLTQLQDCSKNLNLEIIAAVVNVEDGLPNAIDKLLQHSDVILALHDTEIYNRRSVKNILLSAYRLRIPVIGFSESFVNAGALAGVYSTPDNIAAQAADIINGYKSRSSTYKRVKEFPDKFTVSINRQVAKALDLYPPEENSIVEVLQKMEAP